MDVIDRINDLMIENGIDPVDALKISESVRREFCGGLIYVPKKSEAELNAEKESIVSDIKNNIPRDKIAKKYRISKITVWRMAKKIKESRK